MATPKQITINDLSKNDKLTIFRLLENGVDSLQVEKRYLYLDSSGEPIEALGSGRVTQTIPVASLPAAVLSAVQTINNYMYNQALDQEGMT